MRCSTKDTYLLLVEWAMLFSCPVLGRMLNKSVLKESEQLSIEQVSNSSSRWLDNSCLQRKWAVTFLRESEHVSLNTSIPNKKWKAFFRAGWQQLSLKRLTQTFGPQETVNSNFPQRKQAWAWTQASLKVNSFPRRKQTTFVCCESEKFIAWLREAKWQQS